LCESHSSPPSTHSYTSPKVSIKRNVITTQKDHPPNMGKLVKVVAQGNKKDISKSNIRNKIPIRKNLTDMGDPGLSKGSNPHSYTDTFSVSGALSESKYEEKRIIIERAPLTLKRIRRL